MCPYILHSSDRFAVPVAISTLDDLESADLERLREDGAISEPIEYVTWDALSTRLGLGASPNGISNRRMLAMFNARGLT